MTRELLEHTLLEFKWDVRLVSEIVGITQSSIYKKIKKYGLVRPVTFIKGNWNRTKTKCPHGHEYTPETTFVNKYGYRVCRPCDEIRKAAANDPLLHEQKIQRPRLQNSLQKRVGARQPGTEKLERKKTSVCDDSPMSNNVPRLPGYLDSDRRAEIKRNEG